MDDYKKNFRQFLNDDEGMFGFIGWEVNVNRKYYGISDASVTIADCSRRIVLSFPPYKDEREASRKKLALIRNALDEFEKAFEGSFAQLDELMEKEKEKEEEKEKEDREVE